MAKKIAPSDKQMRAWMKAAIMCAYVDLQYVANQTGYAPEWRKLCRAEMAHRRLRIKLEAGRA